MAPHGGYSSSTNFCLQCHAVHGNQYTGEYALLALKSVTDVCATCHGLEGLASKGTWRPGGTNPDGSPKWPGVIGTASSRTAYDVAAGGSKHTIGAADSGGADGTVITENNIWRYSTTSANSTVAAGAGTAREGSGGLYCGSCHTPHGDSGQVVNARKIRTRGLSADPTPVPTPTAAQIVVNWAEGQYIYWYAVANKDFNGDTVNEWTKGQPYLVNLHQGASSWEVCYRNADGTSDLTRCVPAQKIDQEQQVVSLYAYKLLSANPNHTWTSVKSVGTDYRDRDQAQWCGTCHTSKLSPDLGGPSVATSTYHTHPTACTYCHGNPLDGTSWDFPHSSTKDQLLKDYPDAICVTCHGYGSLP